MDEQTTPAQDAEIAETAAPVSSGDDWDDIDLSDLEIDDDDADLDGGDPDGGYDADQRKAGTGENQTKAPAGEAQQETGQGKADQLFTLKHLGETRQVNRDEATVLAQKGLDYDHVKQERDTARTESKRLSAYEDFLKELAAPQNLGVEDLMDQTRAKLLVDNERQSGRKLDQATALERVRLDREKKALAHEREQAQQTQAAQAQQDQTAEKRRQDFLEFARENPGVEAKSIPQEVWDRVNAGESLSAAYAKYENRQLRDRVKALEQNEKNKARTTGSRQSAGKQTAKDPWLAGWDD